MSDPTIRPAECNCKNIAQANSRDDFNKQNNLTSPQSSIIRIANEADSFQNQNQQNTSNINTSNNSNFVSNLFSALSGMTPEPLVAMVNQLSNIFSPFVNLIQELGSGSQNINEQNEEQIANQLKNMSQGLEGQIKGNQALYNNLSQESKESLNEFFCSMSHINEKENLEHLDLRRLIERWRSDRNYQTLLHMVEQIQSNGGGVSFERPELREAFIRTLTSLAHALREEQGNPNSECLEHLHAAVNPVVNNLEIVANNGTDRNLTHEQMQHIGNGFQEAHDHVREITDNPELARHVGSALDGLNQWREWIQLFIQDWFERLEEEEAKDEEKRKQEKLCEERCEKEDEIKKLHALHKKAEKKRKEFLSIKEEAKRQLFNELEIIETEKNRFLSNGNKFKNAEIGQRNRRSDYNQANRMANNEASREDYYKNQEGSLEYTLPPASVCEDENDNSFFDLHC